MNQKVERAEVDRRRDRGGQRDLGIGHAEDVGHDEGGDAHDRRHELAAGRGDGFVRGRPFAAVAGAHHQRDRERAGRGDVGDRGAADRAEQRAGHDLGLGRAARALADELERQVHEQFGAADDRIDRAERQEIEYQGQ